MGLFRGLLGLARRRPSPNQNLTDDEMLRLQEAADQIEMEELDRMWSGPDPREMDSLMFPKPSREREAAFRQKIFELEEAKRAHPWWLGAAGYGGYRLGEREKDK